MKPEQLTLTEEELEQVVIDECNKCMLRGVCPDSIADNLDEGVPEIPCGYHNSSHKWKEIHMMIAKAKKKALEVSEVPEVPEAPEIELYDGTGLRAVGQFDTEGTLVHIYKSVIEAARDHNLKHNSIVKVCLKNTDSTKKYSYKGYIWRYIKYGEGDTDAQKDVL